MIYTPQHKKCKGESKPMELETLTEPKFRGEFTHAKFEVLAVVLPKYSVYLECYSLGLLHA
jgi:hypothetical protein